MSRRRELIAIVAAYAYYRLRRSSVRRIRYESFKYSSWKISGRLDVARRFT